MASNNANNGNQGSSYVTNSQAIKPTTSFMSLKRDQIKMDTYVDLSDGPSFLQNRHGIPSFTEKKGSTEKTLYETERSDHLKVADQRTKELQQVKDALYTEQS